MTLDTGAAAKVLGGLRPYPVAITTVDGGVANGLMSLSAGAASIIPEAPRATISLTKYNLTHDMVTGSGIFVMHLLSAEDDQIEKSLEILMTLGGSSGRDGDKIGKLRTRQGLSGAPVLLDAHSYVEARVTGTLDVQESSIFVGDVIAAEILNPGRRLQIGEAWEKLPAEWIEQYDANHVPQLESARAHRFTTVL
ncbi:flavin reductase family protein [Nocardioides sp. Iso805N]|uniref:flavin reductase family protein n=1 Tax=Nocardioides sp. Iso805N TaxID=1283287 RepID=UPI0003781662|nr:flavin reductase family protein [Nocardioides sp. Iso805N]